MHLLFADESGRLDEDGLFALGGVAVAGSDWHALRDTWHETLRAHEWPLGRELKWHGIRKGEVPPALGDAIFAVLAAAPLTAYVVLLDLPRGREQFPEFFGSAEDTYATALMFLAERFHHLLTARDDVGMIVVDSRFREDDARLRRFFADLSESGTPYMKLDRIVEGLFLGPSHYSIGLQCADLVVACTASAERGGGQARGYLKTLLPRFATHPATGALDGVGIKRFPDTVAPERTETASSERLPTSSRLADAGDFEAAQHVIAKTERRLRGAGLHAEADALDAQLLSVQHCDAVARKQLRYESNVRRRKRRRGP